MKYVRRALKSFFFTAAWSRLYIYMRYFIKDNYYFDIDHQNQFRITGPGNHLFCGITFPTQVGIEVKSYDMEEGQLVVHLALNVSETHLHIPLVSDIRTLRHMIEPVK